MWKGETKRMGRGEGGEEREKKKRKKKKEDGQKVWRSPL